MTHSGAFSCFSSSTRSHKPPILMCKLSSSANTTQWLSLTSRKYTHGVWTTSSNLDAIKSMGAQFTTAVLFRSPLRISNPNKSQLVMSWEWAKLGGSCLLFGSAAWWEFHSPGTFFWQLFLFFSTLPLRALNFLPRSYLRRWCAHQGENLPIYPVQLYGNVSIF